MTFRPTPLSEIAAHVGGRIEGDGTRIIRRVAPLDQAEPGDLSFLANPKYAPALATTQASAVLVDGKVEAVQGNSRGVALVRVDHPYLAYARAVTFLWQVPRPEPGIHPGAVVHFRARVHPTASILPLAHVGADTVIGAGTVVYPGAVVLERCRIGAECLLYPGAVVREDCVLGDRVILNNNVSIGADGYGFAQTKDPAAGGIVHVKIPQVGNVVLEDDVEVGACTCIDRAAMGSTRIGRGTKIDNLVMVGHGCQIGAYSLIVAQSGMAGSSTLGERTVLGARAGILGHLTIGAGTTVFSRSHVTKSTEPGAVVSGNPARPHREQLRQEALLSKMGALIGRVDALERAAAKSAPAKRRAKATKKQAKTSKYRSKPRR